MLAVLVLPKINGTAEGELAVGAGNNGLLRTRFVESDGAGTVVIDAVVLVAVVDGSAVLSLDVDDSVGSNVRKVQTNCNRGNFRLDVSF